MKLERGAKKEVSMLEKGMDFRKPKYRREVFLRFYDFHLKYDAHPGGVYFAMPWLAEYRNMDMEKKLWMATINGFSQNIVTTDIIMREFPDLHNLDIKRLKDWWNIHHVQFKAGSGWDSDRKYFKIGQTGFPQCVESYKKMLGKQSQLEFYDNLCQGSPFDNFEAVWNAVKGTVLSMGRLSTFSYLEYLRIVGINIDCNSLFLDDISGSKSHRNGLCKVLGRDDLDDYEPENPTFKGYDKKTLAWLREEGNILMREAQDRIKHPDVSFFTMESTFCNYKSWYRKDRRYPGVYLDMMHNRIEYAESQWGHNFEHFWQMRKECLPEYLRIENNPNDPTNYQLQLSKEKQNHFRLTGQVIMMDEYDSVFQNDFNNKYYHSNFGLDAFLT